MALALRICYYCFLCSGEYIASLHSNIILATVKHVVCMGNYIEPCCKGPQAMQLFPIVALCHARPSSIQFPCQALLATYMPD